jgi:hypothetical protein
MLKPLAITVSGTLFYHLLWRPVGVRAEEGINATILLVFESVFGVASMDTYNEYAPIDAP